MRDEQETDGRGVPQTSLISLINLPKSQPWPPHPQPPLCDSCTFLATNNLGSEVQFAVGLTHRRGDTRFWFQIQRRPLSPKIPT